MASVHRSSLVHVARTSRLQPLLRLLLLVVLVLQGAFACGSRRDNSRLNLAPPSEKSTVGPGDIFIMEIVGEQDLPKEYMVASDGTVDLPYLPALKVQGLEPQQIARLVKKQMTEKGILSDPSVIVQVKEYHSRRITLLGQVS